MVGQGVDDFVEAAMNMNMLDMDSQSFKEAEQIRKGREEPIGCLGNLSRSPIMHGVTKRLPRPSGLEYGNTIFQWWKIRSRNWLSSSFKWYQSIFQ